jgi:3-hydroxyisobutyrate dehydrogenase-like beta-hydroxyacid dehydrogenase
MANIGTLGFIGLGVMGGAMARNLSSRQDLPTVVFDLSADLVNHVVEVGATGAESIEAVGEAADVVFLSLPSITQVEQVAAVLAAVENPPAYIVDMSTSDVTGTRELGAKLAETGTVLVDAPVARLRQAAKDGTLLITVGSSDEDFELVKPLLSCMGSDIVHAGGLGSGQVIKIINNMVVFQTFNALAEAVAIGKAAGVEAKLLLETLTLGSADSFLLRKSALSTLAVGSFPAKTFPTTYAIKDLNLALKLAGDFNIDIKSAQATMDLLEATRDAGFADEYYPVMVKLIERAGETL